MDLRLAVIAWAVVALGAAIVVALLSGRIGRHRSAMIVTLIGLVVISVEEALITLFWTVSDSTADPEGMVGVLTESARAHVIDVSVYATALFVGMGVIACTAFRRGERWAHRVLLVGWAIVAVTIITTMVTVYARGLPLPTSGGMADGAGYGWEPIAAGLAAWGLGLWLARDRMREPDTIVPRDGR